MCEVTSIITPSQHWPDPGSQGVLSAQWSVVSVHIVCNVRPSPAGAPGIRAASPVNKLFRPHDT